MKSFLLLHAAAVLGLSLAGCDSTSVSEEYRDVASLPAPQKQAEPPVVLTRLVFQDFESKSLKWADLLSTNPPTLGPVGAVGGFPKLDPKRQQLVQMEAAAGALLVGVREEGDDRKANGWVLVQMGVDLEDHGDHAHWHYESSPKVSAVQLDGKQGNPAHLYAYDEVSYLANDENSGYTRLDPGSIKEGDNEAAIRSRAAFHQGGGRHITLAVSEGKVGYASWIDGGGPNKGRVDVTAIKPDGNTTIAYSFALPSGGIHGATAAKGKLFFAPSDGICWVAADAELKSKPGDVAVHHISLGKDEEKNKPFRTGGFTNFGKYVLFVTGEGSSAACGILDAGAETPRPILVSLSMKPGNRPVPPEVVETRDGKRYAFVFHDHPRDVEAENRLSVIDLDPDSNGDYSDATVARSLSVGNSRVEGHHGHHSIAFDADGRFACFTNPGDGTLVVLDLKSLQSVATYSLGGIPTKLLAIGGREEHH